MTGPEFADSPEEKDEHGGGEGGTKNARTRTRLSRSRRSHSVLTHLRHLGTGIHGYSTTPHSALTVCDC